MNKQEESFWITLSWKRSSKLFVVYSFQFVVMGTIKKFEDLEIWQTAREICLFVEFLIQNTELKTNYALRNQIDRSSGSIMDNIAEGFERNGNREFIQFFALHPRIWKSNYAKEQKSSQRKEVNLCELCVLCG